MTIICYSKKHRQLAADSKVNLGWMKFDNAPKIFKLANGAHVACAGSSDDSDVLELLNKYSADDRPSRKELRDTKTEFEGILVYPDNKVFAVFISRLEGDDNWDAQYTPVYEDFVALGCGLEYAYGVLDAGGTPREAVESACKRDAFCGPPIKVVSIDETTTKRTRKKNTDSE